MKATKYGNTLSSLNISPMNSRFSGLDFTSAFTPLSKRDSKNSNSHSQEEPDTHLDSSFGQAKEIPSTRKSRLQILIESPDSSPQSIPEKSSVLQIDESSDETEDDEELTDLERRSIYGNLFHQTASSENLYVEPPLKDEGTYSTLEIPATSISATHLAANTSSSKTSQSKSRMMNQFSLQTDESLASQSLEPRSLKQEGRSSIKDKNPSTNQGKSQKFLEAACLSKEKIFSLSEGKSSKETEKKLSKETGNKSSKETEKKSSKETEKKLSTETRKRLSKEVRKKLSKGVEKEEQENKLKGEKKLLTKEEGKLDQGSPDEQTLKSGKLKPQKEQFKPQKRELPKRNLKVETPKTPPLPPKPTKPEDKRPICGVLGIHGPCQRKGLCPHHRSPSIESLSNCSSGTESPPLRQTHTKFPSPSGTNSSKKFKAAASKVGRTKNRAESSPLNSSHFSSNNFPELPAAKTFYPSESEFADPMKYIASIAEEGRKYGICKIVPPSAEWLNGKKFEDLIKFNHFNFETKLQNVHQLQRRNTDGVVFLRKLNSFLTSHNREKIEELPSVNGRFLQLHRLFKIVSGLGGFAKVSDWDQVSKELIGDPNFGYAIKHHYCALLLEYEHQSLLSSDTNENPQFMYGDGGSWSLEHFKKRANEFERNWFGDTKASVSEIESVYWSLVESGEEPVQVNYGSDLDVSDHKSGFDTTNLANLSGWNLNRFATWPGSVLSHLDGPISGVTVPMLYVGMLFSTFCWHTEDNYLYSINYNHTGAAKRWYGIPGGAYHLFEKVMKETVPEVFAADPMVLFHLVTMISPRILKEHNVPVYTATQQAGEIMLTFPCGYHAGFNTGFNVAESCNFALPDFFGFGRNCTERYRLYGRSSVFSTDQLMINSLLQNPTPEEMEHLQIELIDMYMREFQERKEILYEKNGLEKAMDFKLWFPENAPNLLECKVCKYDCFLSAVACPCSPLEITCLRHSLCECKNKRKYLLFRYTLEDLYCLLRDNKIDMNEDTQSTNVIPKNKTSSTNDLDLQSAQQLDNLMRIFLKVDGTAMGKTMRSQVYNIFIRKSTHGSNSQMQIPLADLPRQSLLYTSYVKESTGVPSSTPAHSSRSGVVPMPKKTRGNKVNYCGLFQ